MQQKHKILLGIALVIVAAAGGYFVITSGLGPKEPATVRVEIPAGLRKEQIAFILADKLGWTDAQIEKFVEADTSPLYTMQEGYVGSGIYNIPVDASTNDVAIMLRQRAQEEQYPYKSKLSAEDWDEALIVASIVERDTVGHSEDRFARAKEIWADLDAGRPIKSEGTIAYLRNTRDAYGESFCDDGKQPMTPECQQDWRLQFHVADARNVKWWFSTPDDQNDDWKEFNTYTHVGLPPRAIANPSHDALDAAVTTRFTTTGETVRH